jgi:hypothetical protein
MNSSEEILKRLSDLEERTKDLEDKEKDPWDKTQVIAQSIGSILIPVAVLLAGHFLSQEISKQQAAAAQTSADASRIQASVDQALALKDLVELLTDEDPARRELAIVSVDIALRKEDAEKILEIIVQSEPSPQVRETAERALNSVVQRKDEDSFVQLFSSIKSERSEGLNSLAEKVWNSSDVATIEFAIAYASQNIENHQGVINTLYIFRKMSQYTQSKSVLLETKSQLNEFLQQASQSPDRGVRDFANQVGSALPELN